MGLFDFIKPAERGIPRATPPAQPSGATPPGGANMRQLREREPRAQTPQESAAIAARLAESRNRVVNLRLDPRGGQRFLDSAKSDRTTSTWTRIPVTGEALVEKDWRVSVARSRDAVENNDHARRFVQLARDNVAGAHGFRFKADIMLPGGKPGHSLDRDFAISDAVDAAFAFFSRAGNFETTGRASRRTFEREWVRRKAVDGEAIAIITVGEDAGPYGFGLQLIDPLQLDPTHREDRADGSTIRAGVECNAAGRVVAYHFREFMPAYFGAALRYEAKTRRVPAELVIHDFTAEVPYQRRGMPWMRSALMRLHNIRGYEDAAIINARISASKMGFFRDKDAQPEDNTEVPMDAQPGVFENIGTREFVPFDPQYPSGEFEVFMRASLRGVSAGLGVSYNSLANDLTAINYSSIRQGALDERDVWTGLQEDTIDNLCYPLFRAWLSWALLAGKITVMGRPVRVGEEQRILDGVRFSGRRWQWVDPLKEIAAAEKSIALGLQSRQSIIRENNGGDPYRVWDDLEEEKDELTQRGVYFPPVAPGASGANANTQIDAGNTEGGGPEEGEPKTVSDR